MQQLVKYVPDEQEMETMIQFTDSISDIKLKQVNPGMYFMAVSSWDGNIMMYTVNSSNPSLKQPEVQPMG